jgi:hypothetical protein
VALMPSVYLTDEEIVELIIERPEVVSMALQKLINQHTEEVESWNTMYGTIRKLRERIKELEKVQNSA